MAEKRTMNVHFMVSEKEREMIERRMAQTGIKSLRAYLLKMAVDGRVIRVELESVYQMQSLLTKTTDAIYRLSQIAQENGSIYASDIEELRAMYDGLWAQSKLILRKLAAMD